MTKIEAYRQKLNSLPEWDDFLLAESGLPGPRGNLELARAVADAGDAALFFRYAALTAEQAPVNSPAEFLAFCGVLGLGNLLAQGNRAVLADLRRHAADPRWRTREAVAMALQHWGLADMNALLAEMEQWSHDSPLVQRAAVAALCEPALLANPAHVERVLGVLHTVTLSLAGSPAARTPELEALRKGLGYGWSVAVAACPEAGKPAMEQWLASSNKHVQWVMRENLKKQRLLRLDAAWVTAARQKLL